MLGMARRARSSVAQAAAAFTASALAALVAGATPAQAQAVAGVFGRSLGAVADIRPCGRHHFLTLTFEREGETQAGPLVATLHPVEGREASRPKSERLFSTPFAGGSLAAVCDIRNRLVAVWADKELRLFSFDGTLLDSTPGDSERAVPLGYDSDGQFWVRLNPPVEPVQVVGDAPSFLARGNASRVSKPVTLLLNESDARGRDYRYQAVKVESGGLAMVRWSAPGSAVGGPPHISLLVKNPRTGKHEADRWVRYVEIDGEPTFARDAPLCPAKEQIAKSNLSLSHLLGSAGGPCLLSGQAMCCLLGSDPVTLALRWNVRRVLGIRHSRYDQELGHMVVCFEARSPPPAGATIMHGSEKRDCTGGVEAVGLPSYSPDLQWAIVVKAGTGSGRSSEATFLGLR